MRTVRILAEFMKADVRERTRRYSFLVTIAASLYLAYLVNDGTVGVRMGNCVPVPNSAWTGMAVALCTIAFVSLVGFYVVKNAIERDRETGVGQILAGTPVSTQLYMLGKLLSNFTVLAFVTVILAIAAVLMQTFGGEGFDLTAVVLPFVFLAFPAMFFVAGTAVFFEAVRFLRGGFGNLLFFFAYSALVAVPMATGIMATDIFGLNLAMKGIQADVRRVVPDYNGGLSIGTGLKESGEVKKIVWEGLPWTAENAAQRAYPIAYGFILALIGGALFDRFSAGATGHRKGRLKRFLSRIAGSPLQNLPGHFVQPVDALLRRFIWGRILVAELRLMLQGLPWWWYAAALGLWIASLAMDATSARMYIFPYLWIWPVFVWSGMGTREQRFRTGSILFSAPRPLARQLPATWGAGFILAMAFASGILLRLAAGGEVAALCSIVAGALFIPSLATALGVWSGTSKTFEALYVALWYIGPAHHTPSIDFQATTDAAVALGSPAAFAAAGLILFFAALAGRWRKIAA